MSSMSKSVGRFGCDSYCEGMILLGISMDSKLLESAYALWFTGIYSGELLFALE